MTRILEIAGLSKSFGALKAVDDISFHVEEGEIVGLIGPNGAGKTTAISLISGAKRPDAGGVVFRGEPVTNLPPHRLVRKGLVRTFQATNVYQSMSVRENVYCGAFPAVYRDFWSAALATPSRRELQHGTWRRTDRILAQLGLAAQADLPASQLPYGGQKTLGVAIALASEPRLMMLDEPAAGLSAEEVDHVAEVIRAVNRDGVSVLVVDHNMRMISALCHRIIVLHHGALLTEGAPQQVTSDPRVIEAYLGKRHEPIGG
jgi:branched-chain amino acid transport system ATP-binding protein